MSRWWLGCLLTVFASVMVSGIIAGDPDWVIAVDVPAPLGGADRLPSEFVRTDGTVYSLLLALPSNAEIGAVGLRADGTVLFVPAGPVDLGGTTFEGRDVVASDGIDFTPALDGSDAGVPVGSRIDAVHESAEGDLFVSFSVPTTIGEHTFSRSDVVRYEAGAGFTPWFDSLSAGVPLYANVVGVGVDASGDLVMTFDVPTELQGTDYLPGELVVWTGGVFGTYASDPSWPGFARARALGLFPPTGIVPDGDTIPGTPLTIDRLLNHDVQLEWSGSCVAEDNDYEVYEGTLGEFTSHEPRLCSTAGETSAVLTPGSGSHYYLVVARHHWREGSHGFRGDGNERPSGPSSCLPRLFAFDCP